MTKIQVLDQHTVDKIAAGEVIERPASVVKELVENSIDAGSTAITVEIKEGGITFIRITDNGIGIEKEDVKTAFLRHATSKIKTVEDLVTVSSLGFRGEALSSIAAVSQVELVSKTSNALTGARYIIQGGKEESFEEIGCPEGTTFLVRNLFFNTPARRKFLKTPATEASHIDALLQRMALAHPNISFKFINNNQNKLYTSGNGNLKDIIYHVFGRDVAGNLLPVEESSDTVKITGFVGKPFISRGNRTYENYFVNGRYIKSTIINKAIEEAYRTYTMVHKYPFVVLNFQIEGDLLDVNVHPTKMELRFKNAEELYRFIVTTIRAALLEKELIPTVSVEKKQPLHKPSVVSKVPEPFEQNRKTKEAQINPYSMRNPEVSAPMVEAAKSLVDQVIPEQKSMLRETSSYEAKHEEKQPFVPSPVVTEEEKTAPLEKQLDLFDQNLLTKEAKENHRIIGQLFKTYWLIQYENKLFIMDQHAAHEKVNYEKLMNAFEKKEIYSQQLEPPMIISLSMKESTALQSYQKYFEELGFGIESFGGNEYCIRSVPANLYGLAEKDIFIELLDSIMDDVGMTNLDLITDKIASMSCKAAVKGNMKLSYAEVDALITELLQLDNPYTCPHGRPTIIAMTQNEIEKKFQRIQS